LLANFLLHHSEHGDNKLLQDFDNKVPINTASNPKRLSSPSTMLWKPQVTHLEVLLFSVT